MKIDCKQVMVLLLMVLALAAFETRADTTNFKIGPLTSHIDWKDWSMKTDEKIFMGIHAIDILQTINHGKDPCYVEVDPITRRLIGKHPSTEKVIAWGIGNAVVSHYGFKFVDNSNMPKWLKNTLKWTSTAIRFDVIHNNYQIGIKLYGNNDHSRAGPRTQQCARNHGLM